MQEIKKLPVGIENFEKIRTEGFYMDARDFDGAKAALCTIIGREALRFSFLSKSERLTEEERGQYAQLVKNDTSGRQIFSIPDETLKDALRTLSGLLYKHYGQKAVLLIDEYDVPLDKAHRSGY